jgi:hypothetical protein
MIAVNLLLYLYLEELKEKQCTCSEKFRDIFQKVIAVKVFFMLIELVALLTNPNTLMYANVFNGIASFLSMGVHFPLSLLFMWNTEQDCACARDWKEYLIYVCFF